VVGFVDLDGDAFHWADAGVGAKGGCRGVVGEKQGVDVRLFQKPLDVLCNDHVVCPE